MSSTAWPITWDLDSLYPHPESDEFQSLLNEFRSAIEQLAADSEELPQFDVEPAAWTGFLDRVADILGQYEDLRAHVGCHAAADAENKALHGIEGRLSAISPTWQQVLTNIELGLRDIDEDRLQTIASRDQQLESILFFLLDRRRAGALRLPKAQELLAAELAVDGLDAWSRLYDRLSGELRIPVMERGEIVRKSPGQVQFDSPERSVRQNNFFASDKAWRTIADSCADALNHIAGARLTKYRRLGVDHLALPLHLNRMSRQTLDTMWQVISDRKHCLERYFSAKAARLGLERLAWYDVQAPLPTCPRPSRESGRTAGASGTLAWDEACSAVASCLTDFLPDFGTFSERAMREGWVEAENRPGKRQGGFCTGYPTRKQSRIFMTFTGSPDSMSTLAHELGHAYHSYVLRDQPLLLQDYPMNLAETASTFAEAVVNDQRLKAASTDHDRLAILDNMCADAVAFLMNIHCRFLFEDRFHQLRADGELTAERLSELMESAQREAYCNSLADDGYNPTFWISKLHFYISGWPFYNFPYTFGYLLSQGLYARAQEAGEQFADQYRRLLIATGCMSAEQAVQYTLGDDLTRPDFWNRCIDLIESRVDQFVQLASAD